MVVFNAVGLQFHFLYYSWGDNFPFISRVVAQESIDRINVEIYECDNQSNANACVCFEELLKKTHCRR